MTHVSEKSLAVARGFRDWIGLFLRASVIIGNDDFQIPCRRLSIMQRRSQRAESPRQKGSRSALHFVNVIIIHDVDKEPLRTLLRGVEETGEISRLSPRDAAQAIIDSRRARSISCRSVPSDRSIGESPKARRSALRCNLLTRDDTLDIIFLFIMPALTMLSRLASSFPGVSVPWRGRMISIEYLRATKDVSLNDIRFQLAEIRSVSRNVCKVILFCVF